jgi:hypothetical protein
MGLFASRNADDYRKAADAVKAGTATKEQKDMNAKIARQAGPDGARAREATR